MKRLPVYLFEGTVQYDVVDWDLSDKYHRQLVLGVYASKGRIQTWANGYRNNEYFMVVL